MAFTPHKVSFLLHELTHLPATHFTLPFSGAEQAWPQPPQLAGSVRKLTQISPWLLSEDVSGAGLAQWSGVELAGLHISGFPSDPPSKREENRTSGQAKVSNILSRKSIPDGS